MNEQARDQFNYLGRLGHLVDGIENLAAEAENLRLLAEYRLGVHVREDENGNIWVEEGRNRV